MDMTLAMIALDIFPDAAFLLGSPATILAANAAASRLTGHEREELVGMSLQQLLPGTDPDGCSEARFGLLSVSEVRLESILSDKAGASIPVTIAFGPWLDDKRTQRCVVMRNCTQDWGPCSAPIDDERTVKMMLTGLGEINLLVDADGVVLDAQEQTVGGGRVAPPGLVGRNFFALFPPGVADGRSRRLRDIIATGCSCRFEDENAGRHYLHDYRPLLDEGGRVRQVSIRTQDLTERKQVLRELRDREARLARAYALGRMADWEISPRSGARRFSPHVAELLGCSELVLHGPLENIVATCHPDDYGPVLARIEEHIATGDATEIEFRTVHPDGSVKHLIAVAEGRYDGTGKLTDFAGTLMDISERRQAQHNLREAQHAIVEIVSGLDEIYWMTDGQFAKLLYASPAYERVLGTPIALPGEATKVALDRIIEEDRSTVMEAIERVKTGKAAKFEARLCTQQDVTRWIVGRAVPLRDASGRVYRIIGMIEEVTGRKQAELAKEQRQRFLEEAVAQTGERLRDLETRRIEAEKLAATGRMAARIAHEINNPMAGIRNSVLLLGDAVPPGHPYHHYVDRVDREIARISNVVRQMYTLYRPVESPIAMGPLGRAVDDVAAILASEAQGREVTIRVLSSPDLTAFQAPEGAMRQILYNLLQNALDATPVGSEVEVAIEGTADVITIAVRDQGGGIPDGLRERILEPFFTTKGNGTPARLGLGLSVTNSLLLAMGGQLLFGNRQCGGGEFRAVVPRVAIACGGMGGET